MDHGSVGLVPRIYGVRDYVKADPAAKKTSPYQEMASWKAHAIYLGFPFPESSHVCEYLGYPAAR